MFQKPTRFEVRRRQTFGFSINWPSDLYLLTSNVELVIAGWVVNLRTNFGVSWIFRSRLIGQQLSDKPRDLATLTFNLGVHGAYW